MSRMNIRNTQRIHRRQAWRDETLQAADKRISVQAAFEAFWQRLDDDERLTVKRFQDEAFEQLRRAIMDGRLRAWSAEGRTPRFLQREGAALEDFMEGRTDIFLMARDAALVARNSGLGRTRRGAGRQAYGDLLRPLLTALHTAPDADADSALAARLRPFVPGADPQTPPSDVTVVLRGAVLPPDRPPLSDVPVTTYGADGRATTNLPEARRSENAPIYT